MKMIKLFLVINIFAYFYNCDSLLIPKCDMIICETMPDDLTYENTATTTTPIWKVWSDLILNSTKSIKISSYYWTMLNNDVDPKKHFPSSKNGEMIFNLLNKISKKIYLEIVQNEGNTTEDLLILQKNDLVKVHYIDFQRLLKRGIQHSKVWIGDDNKAFIGSANMDWRALSQVKELGIYMSDCQDIVEDVDKFWQAFQLLSGPTATIPSTWPEYLFPKYNHTNPFISWVNGVLSRIYTASSPPAFNPPYRTDDLTAILRTISLAEKFVYISVMDMFPLEMGYMQYSDSFWPLIENELKKSAIERKIEVKLLISWWRHSQEMMLEYLKSLQSLSKIPEVKIEVKIFIVPGFNDEQKEIPFSRVSHSKYMVTDNTAYIGTSNWSGDYFKYTGGFSIVAEEFYPNSKDKKSVRTKLEDVFDTDWYSIYAHDLW